MLIIPQLLRLAHRRDTSAWVPNGVVKNIGYSVGDVATSMQGAVGSKDKAGVYFESPMVIVILDIVFGQGLTFYNRLVDDGFMGFLFLC